VSSQRGFATASIDAHDPPEAPCSTGLDAGDRILEQRAPRRRRRQRLGGREERIRGWFAAKALRLSHDAVDADLEELLDASTYRTEPVYTSTP
jgi:hypothetical protein